MPFYYFNNKIDNNYRHEVHTEDCSYLPALSNRTLIGFEISCRNAIERAKQEHPNKLFDGCFWCATSCHRG